MLIFYGDAIQDVGAGFGNKVNFGEELIDIIFYLKFFRTGCSVVINLVVAELFNGGDIGLSIDN